MPEKTEEGRRKEQERLWSSFGLRTFLLSFLRFSVSNCCEEKGFQIQEDCNCMCYGNVSAWEESRSGSPSQMTIQNALFEEVCNLWGMKNIERTHNE